MSHAAARVAGRTVRLAVDAGRLVGQVVGVGAGELGAAPRPGVLTVGIDATPLLGPRTGIGRYVQRVCAEVAARPDAPDQVLTLFSRRKPLPDPLPAHCRLASRAVPARILQPTWHRTGRPGVEWLTGRLDVFHGGNYLVPPTRAAATVVTVHDLTFLHYPQTLHPASRPVLARLARQITGYDAVLTVSHAVAEEIAADLGVPAERITVAPNGVDPDWAAATAPTAADRVRLGVPDRYLLFVGTLEPRKNLPRLVAAHTRARQADPTVPPLLLVGATGWGAGAGHQGRPGVHPLGFVADPDLRSLVAGAVAVCAPSLYEGFGLPVLEGLAAGRPVIASDIAAHREIAHGQAVLVAADDTDAWAQALLTAHHADDPTDPGCDAATRRQAVTRAYTWAASAQVHARLYTDLAGR